MQSDERAYLELLHSLTGELGQATAALLSGDLSGFEQSVSRQQATCAKLEQHALHTPHQLASSTAPVDSLLPHQIDTAIDDLFVASKRFESLLTHSGETTRLLSNLLRSYTGYLPQSKIPAAHPSTWSCRL